MGTYNNLVKISLKWKENETKRNETRFQLFKAATGITFEGLKWGGNEEEDSKKVKVLALGVKRRKLDLFDVTVLKNFSIMLNVVSVHDFLKKINIKY